MSGARQQDPLTVEIHDDAVAPNRFDHALAFQESTFPDPTAIDDREAARRLLGEHVHADAQFRKSCAGGCRQVGQAQQVVFDAIRRCRRRRGRVVRRRGNSWGRLWP
jgi:hypothetical protein